MQTVTHETFHLSGYYSVTREAEIAALAGIPEDDVQRICCADWSEGDAHQEWLDTAPVAEIASWVRSSYLDEQAEND